MAEEPLRVPDADGDPTPIPQGLISGVTLSGGDGDDTVWSPIRIENGEAIFKDPDVRSVLGSQTDAAQTDETIDDTQTAYLRGMLAVIKAARDVLQNAEDADGNAFDVNLSEESADLATQTTLSSVLSELQSKLDVQVTDGDDVALGATNDSAVTNSQDPATVIQALKGLLFKQIDGVSSKGVDSQGSVPSAAPVSIAGQYEINPTQVSDGQLRRLAVNEAGQVILATLSAVDDSLEAVDSVGTVIYSGSEYVVNETRTSGTAAGSGTLLSANAGDNYIVLDAVISFDGDGGIDAQLTDGTNPIWGYTGSEGVSAKGGRKIAEAGEGNALGYSISLGTATSISKYYIEISYITV